MWFQTPTPGVISEGGWPAVVTVSVPPLANENLAGKLLSTAFVSQPMIVSCVRHVPWRLSLDSAPPGCALAVNPDTRTSMPARTSADPREAAKRLDVFDDIG